MSPFPYKRMTRDVESQKKFSVGQRRREEKKKKNVWSMSKVSDKPYILLIQNAWSFSLLVSMLLKEERTRVIKLQINNIITLSEFSL